MSDFDYVGLQWHKSSHSGQGTEACVEIATTQRLHLARDSKSLDRPVLTFTHSAWCAFITAIKNGRFDQDTNSAP
jgi:hypothetical protein